MSKKIIIVFLMLLTSFIGINSVKAEEGEGKVGTQATACIYCSSTNKDDCKIIVNKTNATDDEKNNYRVFESGSFTEFEYASSSVIAQTFEEITGQDVYARFAWSNPSKNNNNGCTNYLHLVVQELHIFGFVQPNFHTFILTNNDNVDSYKQDMHNFIENAFLINIIASVQDLSTTSYKLEYRYGIDEYDLDSQFMSGKVKTIYTLFDASRPHGPTGKLEGCAILTDPVKEKINWALDILKYGGAALAIILGMVDFFKAVLSDDDNASKKAFGNFIKRLVAAILIFLLPLLIQVLFTAVDNPVIKIPGLNANSATCGLGESK